MTRELTDEGKTRIDELLALIDRLERLHRAGESPNDGQLWDLFVKRDQVRQSLLAPAGRRWSPAPRSAESTVDAAARQLVRLVLGHQPGNPASIDAAARALVIRITEALTGQPERGR